MMDRSSSVAKVSTLGNAPPPPRRLHRLPAAKLDSSAPRLRNILKMSSTSSVVPASSKPSPLSLGLKQRSRRHLMGGASRGNAEFNAGSNNNLNGSSTVSSLCPSQSAPSLMYQRMKGYHSSSGTLSNSSTASNGSGWGGVANARMQIVQRSSGATVKSVLHDLQSLCEDLSDDESEQKMEPPLQECAMLAQWSADAYYKVVITKYSGIPTLDLVMRTFPDNVDIQAYCCTTIKNLTNSVAFRQVNGIETIIQSMKNHAQSIHLQSEACEALAAHYDAASSSDEQRQSVTKLLEHAKQMYLTQKGKEAALKILATISIQEQTR